MIPRQMKKRNNPSEKWEYALVTFKKSATKATFIYGNGTVQELEPEQVRTGSWSVGDNAVKINFLTKIGQKGWEIIDILDNDQMFLKRRIE